VRARDLYCGRGFREAESCANEVGASLYIISAGQGLISIDNLIGAYSATVTRGNVDSVGWVGQRKGPVAPDQWWVRLNEALGQPYPIARLVQECRKTLFVFAVSSPYLALIRSDLNQLPGTASSRVRLIGPQLRPDLERDRWSVAVMPYDDRLDGPDSPCPGTKADFPQRAARHFLRTVDVAGRAASAMEHRRLVTEALSDWRSPRKIVRPRYSDDELRKLIEQMWTQANGQVGRALRLLRDREKVACEQGRFKRLFWEVSERRGHEHG
jgi:hypothetical protein